MFNFKAAFASVPGPSTLVLFVLGFVIVAGYGCLYPGNLFVTIR
jgi:hypothetical protein